MASGDRPNPSVSKDINFVVQIGRSFRRIKGARQEEDGTQSIWHQGRGGSELLSWESPDGEILKQELTFFGRIIVVERGRALRTGRTPASLDESSTGMGKSDLVIEDPEPAAGTLEAATNLLENIPEPDTYTNALLQKIKSI